MVAKVDAEREAAMLMKAARSAEIELKNEIARLKTSPEDADLGKVLERVGRLAASIKRAGIDNSLVRRAERAVKEAERVKIEANAKLISDSVERFVNFFAINAKTLMPEGGMTKVVALERAAAKAKAQKKGEYGELETTEVRQERMTGAGMWWAPLMIFEGHLHGDW